MDTDYWLDRARSFVRTLLFSSEATRKAYDRFGEKFASSPHHDAWLENPATMAFYHMGFYGSALFSIFVLTLDESRSRSKWWCLGLLFAVAFYELMAKYDWDSDLDPLVGLFPSVTLYEKIEVLHMVLIFVIQLLTHLAAATYVDITELRHMQVLAHLDVLMEAILDIEVKGKKKPAEGDAAGAEAPKRSELARRAKVDAFKARLAQGDAAKQANKGGGTNWVSLIITAVMLYSWWVD